MTLPCSSRIVFDDTLERGRWEKDEDGRRYWRGPSPQPGHRVVLKATAEGGTWYCPCATCTEPTP